MGEPVGVAPLAGIARRWGYAWSIPARIQVSRMPKRRASWDLSNRFGRRLAC